MHLDQGGAGVLEPVLDLGPLPASGGGLLEGGLALFGGEGRKGHGPTSLGVDWSGTDAVREI